MKIYSAVVRFAPRMWRCFKLKSASDSAFFVCSTHVEMFLGRDAGYTSGRRLLHACGDVSLETDKFEDSSGFAPRMWRCFYQVGVGHK